MPQLSVWVRETASISLCSFLAASVEEQVTKLRSLIRTNHVGMKARINCLGDNVTRPCLDAADMPKLNLDERSTTSVVGSNRFVKSTATPCSRELSGAAFYIFSV
jgi:hypothetical protein